MELTALQLNEVKNYVAQGWKNPDMQIAVTNHIKYRLQERIEKDSKLSLNDALLLTHAEFGPQGFKVFEDNMKAEAKNKYSKLFLRELVNGFKIVNLIAALAFAALVCLLFVTIQPEKFSRVVSVAIPCITGSLPIYLILYSLIFGKAKLYKSYHTMMMSYTVLFKKALIPSFLMTTFYNIASLLLFDKNYLLVGICFSLMILSGVLFINAGYRVHKAALRDCEAITL